MTDEQKPTAGNGPSAAGDDPQPVTETPMANDAPSSAGVSRRKVLIWGGAGAVGVAALGAGAVAFYSSQTTNTQKGLRQGGPGGQTPQGSGSRMPRDRSGVPSGARPSGARSGRAFPTDGSFPTDGTFPSGGPGGFPSGMPTDQPT